MIIPQRKMKRLGQYFLKNGLAIQKIINALALASGDVVVEIGPGHGELTLPLLEACGRIGCAVVAIEKDSQLAKDLEENIGANKKLRVIRGDALKLIPFYPSCKVVGNIPYYITGKLLRVMGELEHKPTRIVLMVQKEVAERIIARPPKMNRLAASVQFWSEISIIDRVPSSDFDPPPGVNSAIILFETKGSRPNIDPERYYRAVRTLFAQPRKTILNNLSEHQKDDGSKNEISFGLKKIMVNPNDRPQDLDVAEITAIAEALF